MTARSGEGSGFAEMILLPSQNIDTVFAGEASPIPREDLCPRSDR